MGRAFLLSSSPLDGIDKLVYSVVISGVEPGLSFCHTRQRNGL